MILGGSILGGTPLGGAIRQATTSIDFSSATTDGADVTAASVGVSVDTTSATTDGADISAGNASVIVASSSATNDGADTSAASVGAVIATSAATTDGQDVTAAAVVTAPSDAGGHGFEMYGGKRVVRIPLRTRVLAVATKPVKPKTVKAQRAAKVIEVKAAKLVLADGGEQKMQALMRQWVALAPIPQQADPYELFLASVALRIRQIEQDDEDAIFMMMMA